MATVIDTEELKGAVIYARVSPQPKINRKEATIASQIDLCHKQCELSGLKVLATFSDRGKSGSLPAEERDGLRDAMRMACQQPAAIVAYSLDRISRSVRELSRIVDELGSNGAQMILIKESIDTTTYTGRFVFTVFAALAEMERERVAERTRDALRSRFERGVDLKTNNPPYGYRIGEDGKMYVYEPEMKTLKLVFEMRERGLGSTAIARELAALGHVTRAGTPVNRRWVDSHITRARDRRKEGRAYGHHGRLKPGMKAKKTTTHFPGRPKERLWLVGDDDD